MNEKIISAVTDSNASGCLDWESSIQQDKSGFTILPEGDYRFRITNFERGRYAGGTKIPACPQAKITAAVDYEGKTVEVRFSLLLYVSLEWRLSSFFRCIGLKQAGMRMTMDWTKVPGARGMFHLKPNHFTDTNGKEHDGNQVAYFLDYDPALWPESVPKDAEPDWLEEAEESLPF